jgi:hypothetical protein
MLDVVAHVYAAELGSTLEGVCGDGNNLLIVVFIRDGDLSHIAIGDAYYCVVGGTCIRRENQFCRRLGIGIGLLAVCPLDKVRIYIKVMCRRFSPEFIDIQEAIPTIFIVIPAIKVIALFVGVIGHHKIIVDFNPCIALGKFKAILNLIDPEIDIVCVIVARARIGVRVWTRIVTRAHHILKGGQDSV